MTDHLKDKLDKVKDEHAAEIVDQRLAAHDERSRMEAMFLLGRIKQIGHDARAIYTALSSQEIRTLEHFQQERLYERFGYQTFVDFLEKSEYAPMSKRQYYDRREILNTHGDEIYDLLTSVGISVRAQRMLGKGDLSIKDDRLVIGDQEIELSNSGVIKDVLKEFVDEIRDLKAADIRKDTKIEKLEQQLDRGQSDYDELQRNLDAMRSGDPYEISLAGAVTALLELTETIGQLSDELKAKRGPDAMPVIWEAVQRVRSAYGSKFSFEDKTTTTPESDLDLMAAAVFDGDEDLDEAIDEA